MAKITDRIRSLMHAWNAFDNVENSPIAPTNQWQNIGASYGTRPDRSRLRISNERSIISSIYTRIGVDAAGIKMVHARTDTDGNYSDTMATGLNNCLTVEANIDQAARAFRQDIFMTLCDKGVIAIVPVDTTLNPQQTGGYDIKTLRVADVVAWYPEHVTVNLFNQVKGIRQEITLSKSMVAIVENPLYAVMNEPSSTLQRLISKLNMLDAVDQASSSGKLDLIIQLPYVIKSEARREQAEQRRKDIEFQLKGSQYGIAYTDGTEKITQLNRPTENNLMSQVDYLTTMLYGQLGITADIMNGTANEEAMVMYFNRTIEPLLDAVTEAMNRTFLTSTARAQLQSIMYFRDAFKLVPVSQVAEIADKFRRNEILTSNEIRVVLGVKPSKDPMASNLSNPNMPDPGSTPPGTNSPAPPVPDQSTITKGDSQNGT